MGAVATERLEARLTPRQDKLIRRAAEIMGTPVSRFLIEAAQEKADKVIRENMILDLSIEAEQKILHSIENPPEPTEALKALFTKHEGIPL